MLMFLSLPQSTSGISLSNQFQIIHQDASGTSNYTIFYYVPPAGRVGSSLNISALLHVNSLTGLKLFIRDYTLTVVLSLDNGRTIINSVNVSASEQKWLYPGGRWGPLNISLPISEQNTGLSPGMSFRANVTISLLTTVYYDNPVSNYFPESGQGNAGTAVLQDLLGAAPWYTSSFVPYILMAGGSILLLFRVVFFRTIQKRT
jgi:hypothetical protein